MKRIIEHIYDGCINETERHVEKTPYDEEENRFYGLLLQSFSDEQKILFEKFYDAQCMRYSEEKARAYTRGFKTGVWLGLELVDFNPDFRE